MSDSKNKSLGAPLAPPVQTIKATTLKKNIYGTKHNVYPYTYAKLVKTGANEYLSDVLPTLAKKEYLDSRLSEKQDKLPEVIISEFQDTLPYLNLASNVVSRIINSYSSSLEGIMLDFMEGFDSKEYYIIFENSKVPYDIMLYTPIFYWGGETAIRPLTYIPGNSIVRLQVINGVGYYTIATSITKTPASELQDGDVVRIEAASTTVLYGNYLCDNSNIVGLDDRYSIKLNELIRYSYWKIISIDGKFILENIATNNYIRAKGPTTDYGYLTKNKSEAWKFELKTPSEAGATEYSDKIKFPTGWDDNSVVFRFSNNLWLGNDGGDKNGMIYFNGLNRMCWNVYKVN